MNTAAFNISTQSQTNQARRVSFHEYKSSRPKLGGKSYDRGSFRRPERHGQRRKGYESWNGGRNYEAADFRALTADAILSSGKPVLLHST